MAVFFFDLVKFTENIDCRPFSVLKTLTGSQAEKSFLSVTKRGFLL